MEFQITLPVPNEKDISQILVEIRKANPKHTFYINKNSILFTVSMELGDKIILNPKENLLKCLLS